MHMYSPAKLPAPTGLPAALPLQPPHATPISARLSMLREGDRVVYFVHTDPVCSHTADHKLERNLCPARFALFGLATQSELARAHGISQSTVSRAVQRLQVQGELGFAPAPKPRRPDGIVDPAQLAQAARMLRSGLSLYRVAQQLGVSQSTLWRYTQQGLLPASQCLPRRRAGAAVSGGGVLTALPSLLQAGLLRHLDQLTLPKGFYGLQSLLLLWAFLLLGRVRCAERLRYQQPGEWGALLGLDRCPCPRTLRRRFHRLQRARHARVKAVGQSAHCAPIALATEPPDERPGWLHPRIEPVRRQLALVRPAPPTVRRGCVVPGPLANILFVAQVCGKPNLQVRTDHGPAVCRRGPPIDNLRGAIAPPAPRGISPSASPLLQIPAQTACLIPGLFRFPTDLASTQFEEKPLSTARIIRLPTPANARGRPFRAGTIVEQMILAVKLDGSYRWRCDDCGAERNEYPHRGPRNSLCRRCQNIRYRSGRSPAQIAFERMGAARLGVAVRRMPGLAHNDWTDVGRAFSRRPAVARLAATPIAFRQQ